MNKKNRNIDYTELISKYLTNEATSEETAALEKWVKADPDNKRFFIDYKHSWILSKIRKPDSRIDIDAEWESLSQLLFEESDEDRDDVLPANHNIDHRDDVPPAIPLYKRKSYSRLYKIAAVITITIALAFYLYHLFTNPGKERLIAINSMEAVILSDGSDITLNRNSKLEYPQKFNKNTREVTLEGEAFFRVTPFTDLPFIVKTDKLIIKVLGTSFYVNARKKNADIEVIVSTGRVSLQVMNQDEMILNENEKGIYSINTGTLTKAKNKDPNYISWKTRYLVFTDTNLESVISGINSTYYSDIRISSPQVRKCRLTATFENQSLEAVIEIIRETFDLSISRENGAIFISGEGCE